MDLEEIYPKKISYKKEISDPIIITLTTNWKVKLKIIEELNFQNMEGWLYWERINLKIKLMSLIVVSVNNNIQRKSKNKE